MIPCPRIGIAAALSLCLAANTAVAQRPAGCRPVPNRTIEVEVRIDVPAPRFDRTLSREQLTGFAPHGPGTSVLGLTRSRLNVASQATYAYYPEASGVCIWIERVDVVLRYSALEVYVAEEYDLYSCAYREILRHENLHVAIARAHVDQYANKMQLSLDSLRIPTARAPMPAASVEQAQRQTNIEIGRLLTPVFDRMSDAVDLAQAAIDTPQAYRTVFQLCNDW